MTEYTINHVCGHQVTKVVLSATEYKRRQAVKAMELKRCARCIKEGQTS